MVLLGRMKQRSTTPVSTRGLATKSVAIAAAVAMAIVPPFGLQQQRAYADQYDDQINALQSEIDQYKTQANALGDKVRTLEGEKQALDGQIATIRSQIQIIQTKIAQLKQQIIEKQAKIDATKAAIGKILADMYATDNISPLEMLASSNNIADYVDQQEARSSMSDKLSQAVDTIKKEQAELEQSKADQERMLVDQQKSQDALQQKEAEKANLIAATQNDQNAYNSLVSDRQAKQLAVMQAQQAAIEAAIRAAGNGRSAVIVGTNSGGYPWNSSNCYVDANAWSYGGADGMGTDGYGYGCRQCVSYVAWRVGKERGYVPVNWGNAYDWVANGQAAGYTVSRTPRAGSAGVITVGGSPGHIVWVDSVNGDGTLTVSQYNYYNAGGAGWGNFSQMIVPSGTYQWFIYF